MNYRIIFLVLLLTAACGFAETEVTKIVFEHNSVFSDDDLLEVIHSEEDEEFEPRLLKLDKILLSNFFRTSGYLVVEVNDSLAFSRDRTTVIIKYKISTGPRYYFGGVVFNGVHDIDTTKLQEVFEDLPVGNPFNEGLINDGKTKVENIYYNNGKPFVNIKTDYRFVKDSLVFADFQIAENQTIYIKKINYIGLDLVQKFLIRRELELTKGDLYNREAIEKTQQNIYGTGLFRFVRLEIEPIPDEPQNVILNIFVKERDPRWIGVNFGVGHEQYYGSTAEVTLQGGHRNLFGTARSISLHLTPSFLYEFSTNSIVNAENQIALKFVEPWIGNTRTPGVYQISYHQYRLPNSADFNLLATSFGVSHKFREDIEINGKIEAKFLKVLDKDSLDQNLTTFAAGQSQIYTVSTYAKKDTRNNLFNPDNGSLTDFSISYSQSIGKQETGEADINKFFTVISSWSRYQPWKPKIGKKRLRWTLASRLKLGAIFEAGETKSIPVSELFFAGGATTVRGFQEQLLGPVKTLDKNGKIETSTGGKLIALGNIEARIPLFWLFVGEIFIDAGNVWAELQNFDYEDIRLSTGAGIAVITPLGPVRVDYGYKLQRQSIDPSPDAFHLGIYFAF